jgi:hypothetical protein
MNDSRRKYLDLIHGTRRCRPEVLETAKKMADAPMEMFEDLSRMFIEMGEDTSLGILMNVCAVRKVGLSPELLPGILEVIEPFIDFAPLLRFQGKEAIPFLLEAAESEAVSLERQAYAGILAAEMSVLYGQDTRPIRRVLRILEQTYYSSPAVGVMLAGASALIDRNKGTAPPDTDEFLCRRDLLEFLPETPPPVIIGDGGTVRRPVPKIGRNDPCSCGSGKKYKKCCMEKDQQRFRDASSYEGLTRSQVIESPDLVDDAAMIREMRSYELKKLNPTRLNVDQLMAAYKRCELFGLRERAFDMLLEIEKRDDKDDFDRGHFFDLMDSALDAGDLDLVERISEHMPWTEDEELFETARVHLALLRHRELLEALDRRLREEMADGEGVIPDRLLIRLSYGFEKKYPALSIVFARAHISGHPNAFLGNETLLGAVRRARAELNMESWDDPIEDYMEWRIDMDMEEAKEREASDALSDLSEKLTSVRGKVKEGQRELREKEIQLKAMADKLEKQKSLLATRSDKVKRSSQISSAGDKETIARLRGRIEALKTEIGSQQQIRRDLRKELHEERHKSEKQNTDVSKTRDPVQSQAGLEPPRTIKKILIPEFLPAFRRACAAMPVVHAANALKAVSGFSAGDKNIWRQTKPIKRIPGCFRIRIGRDYRLLLNWKPEEEFRVLDCIHRSELESWIHGHASA